LRDIKKDNYVALLEEVKGAIIEGLNSESSEEQLRETLDSISERTNQAYRDHLNSLAKPMSVANPMLSSLGVVAGVLSIGWGVIKLARNGFESVGDFVKSALYIGGGAGAVYSSISKTFQEDMAQHMPEWMQKLAIDPKFTTEYGHDRGGE